uniref:Uncharacterized protein n=1 Tax=Glossina pallidipes TaxID=7398 RepID=A0A1A9ZWP3_GLOPL
MNESLKIRPHEELNVSLRFLKILSSASSLSSSSSSTATSSASASASASQSSLSNNNNSNLSIWSIAQKAIYTSIHPFKHRHPKHQNALVVVIRVDHLQHHQHRHNDISHFIEARNYYA